MTAPSTDRVTIIGAGLAGSLLACFLGQAGYRVSVYEKLADPRIKGFVGGRSINLALSARGISALREVGLADEVLKCVIPMPGRMIHTADSHTHFQAYSKNPTDAINSVSRSGLNLILLNAAAKHPNVEFFFDHRCMAIDFKMPTITFEKSDHSRVTVDTDHIIGADGAFSAVRLAMMLNSDRFEYGQHYLEHGYKELTIPPANQCGVDPKRFDGFAMNPNALHIWPRGGYMMIALPNQDRSFTCTCFWPFSGSNGFDALCSDAEIHRFFEQHFPDAVPLMPTLVEDFKRHPTSSLVTVRCWPWNAGDKALLIGDAAHAIVPFYGQGMNAAFEDCSMLMQCLEKHRGDFRKAFVETAELRKPNAEAIADMAVENFIEMRDKTASTLFRARKHVEHGLHALLPGWFLPKYNMISFSTIPYAEARRRSRRQAMVIAIAAMVVSAALLAGIVAAVIAVT